MEGKGFFPFTALVGLLSSMTPGVSSEGDAVVKTFPTFFTLKAFVQCGSCCV